MRKTDEKRIRQEFRDKFASFANVIINPDTNEIESYKVSGSAKDIEDYLIQKLEEQEKEIVERIYNYGKDGEKYDPRKSMAYLDFLYQSIKRNDIINSLKKE